MEDAPSSSTDDLNKIEEVASSILDGIVSNSFQLIEDKYYKLKCVEMYYGLMMRAVKEMHHIYDMPLPCGDFSEQIKAWDEDVPAKPSPPPDDIPSKFIIRNQ